jgi:NAD(P) transhydrogenase subunit beta
MSHEAATLPSLIHIAYLVSAVCFILGLKRLSSPATARSGNLIAAAGMGIAVVATLFIPGLGNGGLLTAALAIGAIAGVIGARRVPMTDMPQMVAMLNGLGGGAAALVAFAEFHHVTERAFLPERAATPEQLFGAIIGSVSFSGSAIAFAKLQSLISEKAIPSSMLRVVNIALFVAIALIAGSLLTGGPSMLFVALLLVALTFGMTMVVPIGGADMPVVISLLNSFTGLAAASTGFVLSNNSLIIAGTLVGASGGLLTVLMCKAMNRSLGNVLFAGVGAGAPAGQAAGPGGAQQRVNEITAEDTAILLANVRSLIIVPGYGMAVAQAQHAVREMADILTKRGVEVRYAIHPVAGRMPGHMNVLLAEANVPYTQLFDIEQINSQFEQTDVALIIGANDVVNPSARTDKSSPIYGMPILDADKARHVIIVKRSMKPGFAGVDNPLYYMERTTMLFGDAKSAINQVVEALKAEGA